MKASDLARKGWQTVPAAAGGRHPESSGWSKDGHSQPIGLTPEQAESREAAGYPDRYCVLTGPVSGIFDVETDIDKDTGEMVGEQALTSLGPLPDGPYMVTPSGSKHRLFQYPDLDGDLRVKTDKGVLPKVDVRGDGGQFFALDDGTRTWHNMHLPIPEAPAWLLERVVEARPRPTAAPADPYEGEGYGDPRAVAWIERLIDGYKDLPWEGHGWNDAFRKAVRAAAGCVAGGLLDHGWAEEALLGACTDLHEALAVFHSTWKNGYAHPIDRMRVEGQAEERTEPVRTSGLVTVSAHDLSHKTFPPVRWIVPNLIPEGLTLIGGKPKVGKSWFSLDLGDAVASGGSFLGRDVEQGTVLYLALEDTERRLKDRLEKLGGSAEHMHLAVEAPRLPDLIGALDQWAEAVDRPRLVIVDTIGHIRPPKGEQVDQYTSAYEDYTPLKRWAESHRLGLVVITHTRKNGVESTGDPLDAIAGSMGQAGAADTVAVLEQTKFRGRGRDVSEFHLALTFDPATYRWTEGTVLSETERATLDMILNAAGPVRASDVGEAHHRRALKSLKERGLVVQDGERGPYRPARLVTEGES